MTPMFGQIVHSYFEDHLKVQKGLRPGSLRSYRDTLRLFLNFMIQHHQGAVAMVQQLLAVPAAAQDDDIFRFVADVNVDQTTEIDRMRVMLSTLPPG